MSLIKRAPLLVRKFSGWLAYFIVLFIVAEIGASYALEVYRYMRLDLTDYSFIDEDLYKELAFVQKNALPSFHRWYYNYPNFKGRHVITDNSGFRIDANAIDGRDKVGMFGGSTTFSVLTDQRGTISEQASDEKYQILNFGVGGYSTSAEIMTLVEAIRAYPDMKSAIFYDGVNELGRAVGVENTDTPEFLVGAPYKPGISIALENSGSTGFSFRKTSLYYIYSKIITTFKSEAGSLTEGYLISSIVKRYYANLKVIKGICDVHSIQCLFTWQPSIYTVQDGTLTPEEAVKKNSSYAKQYYIKLTNAILTNPMASKFKVIDLTHSLDAKKSRIFYDWHHLNSKGNKLVAEALKDILRRAQPMNE